MNELDRAYLISCRAHMGQKDDGGAPYIVHPVAVCDMVEGEREKITALLHDVVEKSEFTLDDLEKEGFGADVLAAVDALSRRKDEKYKKYIKRVMKNSIAVEVKLADLRHNALLSRYPRPDAAVYRKLKRCVKYLIILTEYKNGSERGEG